MTTKPQRGIVVLVRFGLAVGGLYLTYAYLAERFGWAIALGAVLAYVLISGALVAA